METLLEVLVEGSKASVIFLTHGTRTHLSQEQNQNLLIGRYSISQLILYGVPAGWQTGVMAVSQYLPPKSTQSRLKFFLWRLGTHSAVPAHSRL